MVTYAGRHIESLYQQLVPAACVNDFANYLYCRRPALAACAEGTGVLPKQSEDKLRAVLTDEEYVMITGGRGINVKFRIAEILGKYFK